MSGGINYKGKLQEFLQKSNNDLPIYTTLPDNTMFTSTISFCYNNKEIKLTSDKLFGSKKQAEQNISQEALGLLDNMLNKEYVIKSTITDSYNIIIIIDYENYSDDMEIDRFKLCNNNITVRKYASSFCSKSETADVIVNSTRRDVADIKICCDVGVIFNNNDAQLVVIITNDHFASCLSDIYNKCYHVQSIKHCIEKLNNFLF